MKIILLILVIIWSSMLAYCQSLNPDVITTAGNSDVNATNIVSWTIGECIPETFSNVDNKLTQGYQQGVYEIITAIDNTENLIKINVYPNPATDYVNLEIQLQDSQKLIYQLYDMNGRCLRSENISSEISVINLANYSSNTYILNVYTTEKKLLKSFKILKIK